MKTQEQILDKWSEINEELLKLQDEFDLSQPHSVRKKNLDDRDVLLKQVEILRWVTRDE